MALAKVMLKHLLNESIRNPEFAAELREIFDSLGLQLVKPKKEGKPDLTFMEQFKASRFQRPEYIHMLENYHLFLECWKKHTKRSEEYQKAV